MHLFTLPLLAICFGAWIAGGYDNQTVPVTPTPLIGLKSREPRWGIFFSYEKACTRACVRNGKFGGRMIGGVCRCWCVRNEQAPCKGAYPSCNRLCKLNFYPMGGDCVDGLYCYCTCGVRQPQSPNSTETTTASACTGGGPGPAINGDNSGQTVGNAASIPSGSSSAVQGPPPASQGPYVSNPTGTGPGSGSPDSSSGSNTPGGPFTNEAPGSSGGAGGGSQNQPGPAGGGSGSSGGPATAGGGDGGSVAPGATSGNGGGPPPAPAAPTPPVKDIGRWEAFKREYERLKALVPKYLGKQPK